MSENNSERKQEHTAGSQEEQDLGKLAGLAASQPSQTDKPVVEDKSEPELAFLFMMGNAIDKYRSKFGNWDNLEIDLLRAFNKARQLLAAPQPTQSETPKSIYIAEMDKAIKCLALELPGPVWDDVNKKWQAFKSLNLNK